MLGIVLFVGVLKLLGIYTNICLLTLVTCLVGKACAATLFPNRVCLKPGVHEKDTCSCPEPQLSSQNYALQQLFIGLATVNGLVLVWNVLLLIEQR